MITHYFRTLKDKELKVCDEPRKGTWTHVVAPSEEEFETLVEQFDLDEAIAADASDFFEVPRFEQEEGVLYFFTRYPFDERDEDIDTAPLLIVVGGSFVLTIAQRDVPFLSAFIDGKKPIATTQKTKLFIQFMGALTTAFEAELTHMRRSVYRDRSRVRDIKGRDIQRLVSYEHQLNDAIAAMTPTNASLQHLTTGNHIEMFSDDLELTEDLMIANNQLMESARAVLKTIQNVRGASEAMLTQRLNNTIQMLTALTVVLTIPTIIASLYGMNVPLPLGERPYAFWLVLGVIAAVMALVVRYFSKRHWF